MRPDQVKSFSITSDALNAANGTDLNALSHDDAIKQILALTNELREFENSSRELEDAMELELEELNKEKTTLQAALRVRDEEVKDLKQQMVAMERELGSLTTRNNELVNNFESELSRKTKQLTDIEIRNDYLENNERITASKLRSMEEQYNETLEQNVILQGEVTELTELINNDKLVTSNNAMKVADLEAKITQLELENERAKIRQSKPEKFSRYKTPAISNTPEIEQPLYTPPSMKSKSTKSISKENVREMNAKTSQLSQHTDTSRTDNLGINGQALQKKKGVASLGIRSGSHGGHLGSASNDKENEVPRRAVSEGTRQHETEYIEDSSSRTGKFSTKSEPQKISATKSNGNRLMMAFRKI